MVRAFFVGDGWSSSETSSTVTVLVFEAPLTPFALGSLPFRRVLRRGAEDSGGDVTRFSGDLTPMSSGGGRDRLLPYVCISISFSQVTCVYTYLGYRSLDDRLRSQFRFLLLGLCLCLSSSTGPTDRLFLRRRLDHGVGSLVRVGEGRLLRRRDLLD